MRAVFNALIARDTKVMLKMVYNQILEGIFYLTIAYIIYAQLLPSMGFKSTMVAPLFWGMLVIVLTQEAYDAARFLATDLARNPVIQFYLTLPIGFSWLLVRFLVATYLQLVFNSFLLFLGGVFLFGPHVMHSLVQMMLFLVTYFIIVLFFASFSLAIGTATSLSWFLDNMWSRILIPMIFGGCLYVPWYATYSIAPRLAILFLMSPFTYAAEGLRAIVFGQEGYLPWFVCMLMMCALIVLNLVLFRRWFVQHTDPVVNL